nr:hypothetical protein [uncultured Lachnoclostridium sp.]
MEIKLPIGQAKIRSTIFEVAPLSIMAISDDYLDWFYSNYIQLCSYDDFTIKDNALDIQFYGPEQAFHSPYLRKQYFSWESMVRNKVDIVDFLRIYITNGHYYYGSLDLIICRNMYVMIYSFLVLMMKKKCSIRCHIQ